MKTETVKLYVHKRITPCPFSKDHEVNTHDLSKMDHLLGELVVIATQEVEVEIPDVDVTAQAIDALERNAEAVMQRAREEVQKIHDRIKNLRCLDHTE